MAERPSSGARMIAAGKRAVQCWLDPADHAKLARAAKAEGAPMTQILILAGLRHAEKILKKNEKRA